MRTLSKLMTAAAALAALACAVPAAAAEPVEIVSPAVLAQMRGGFDVGGFSIGLGADMRSFVDGQLVMESRLTIGADQLASLSSTGAPLSLQALSDTSGGQFAGGGFGLTLPDGVTLMHNLGDGQLSNVLVNTSSNRDLRQEIALTVTLPGFEAIQAGMNAARIGQEMASESSLRGIAGH